MMETREKASGVVGRPVHTHTLYLVFLHKLAGNYTINYTLYSTLCTKTLPASQLTNPMSSKDNDGMKYMLVWKRKKNYRSHPAPVTKSRHKTSFAFPTCSFVLVKHTQD